MFAVLSYDPGQCLKALIQHFFRETVPLMLQTTYFQKSFTTFRKKMPMEILEQLWRCGLRSRSRKEPHHFSGADFQLNVIDFKKWHQHNSFIPLLFSFSTI
jgi:hypothetical protein